MKALTVCQPWTASITWLEKTPENRSWPCPPDVIGTDIAIHAGQRIDRQPAFVPVPLAVRPGELFQDQAEKDAWTAYCDGQRRDTANWPARMPLGAVTAVTAVTTVTGCHHADNCPGCPPWAVAGQYHWELDGTRPLQTPVPCPGQRKLWTLPDAVEQQVRSQLARAS